MRLTLWNPTHCSKAKKTFCCHLFGSFPEWEKKTRVLQEMCYFCLNSVFIHSEMMRTKSSFIFLPYPHLHKSKLCLSNSFCLKAPKAKSNTFPQTPVLLEIYGLTWKRTRTSESIWMGHVLTVQPLQWRLMFPVDRRADSSNCKATSAGPNYMPITVKEISAWARCGSYD